MFGRMKKKKKGYGQEDKEKFRNLSLERVISKKKQKEPNL